MSVLIGSAKGPHHNSPHDAAEIWADSSGVSVNLFAGNGSDPTREGISRKLDPVAARNLAALLVRGSEEVERIRARTESR